MRFHPVNVEKDYWVCWLLKQLFTIPEYDGWLVFKGGTSLSKCFNLIRRFSEDIDLAVDFEKLGFTGDRDPRQPQLSRTKRGLLLESILAACRDHIAGPFLTTLGGRVRAILGESGWTLTVNDQDPHIVEFAYPSSLDAKLDYIRPSVSLELGTHAEPIPREPVPVRPYAAEAFPQLFAEPSCPVLTVVARRTFWEKATILHAEYHRPLEKRMLPRYSRHYVDVALMARSPVKAEALADLALLQSVVTHKDRFYPAGWARYPEARKGTFRMVPRDERLLELRRDHQAMQPMFFGDPPLFDDVLRELAKLETEING
ncbi:MAG TPA: nucleotidyl transferase AbiEii/AbiGii toxin family protein [Planctomycetota bacterium]|nr:nucleotidyl transferase AbiEii/AbiGii toxin family protein [Planctomycetota bacterium]